MELEKHNDLTILESAGQDDKLYHLVKCRCDLCGQENNYRKSYVLLGRTKRCKSCNLNIRIKRYDCKICNQTFEKRNMVNSKRIGGWTCKSCYNNSMNVKCKECDNIVDISNGKHSNLCSIHWNKYRIAYSLLHTAKYRSKKLSIDFNLDIDWIKDRLNICEVTGIPFEIRDVKVISSSGSNYGDRHPHTPTIDKIDPNKGYTKDNCRVVIWWYNLSKSIWSDDMVLETINSWFTNKGLNGKFSQTL